MYHDVLGFICDCVKMVFKNNEVKTLKNENTIVMKNKYSKKRFPALMDELACESCNSGYCFLKTFVESLHPEPFVLIQLKCIEFFKWEESERKGYDVGWNDAGMIWATSGYAGSFRAVFNEELSPKENYLLTLEHMKNLKKL